MKVILLLAPFISFASLAAPQCGTNKTVSLFQKGRSLAQSRITDQDGMNTCGSNTLAHVIKSSLKTNKDLSYMDIALQASKGNWGKTNNPTRSFMVSKDRMAFEGMENFCEAVETLKKSGGVCPQEHFSFESTVYSKWGGNDSGKKQMELMLTLSRFLDVQNNFYTFQTAAEKTKELQKILKYIDGKKLTYAEKCKVNGEGKNGVDFHETFQSLMGNLMLWVSNHKSDNTQKPCVDASIKYFNSFVTTPFSGKDSHPLDIRPEMKAKFKKTFGYDSLFSQWKKGISPPGHEFSLPLAKFIDQNSNALGLTKACNLTAADADHPLSGKQLYQPTLTKSVLKELNGTLNSRECEKKQLALWIKSSKASKEVEALCPGLPGTRELMGAFSVLPLWDENLSTILPRLYPEGKAEMDHLSSIIAPTCAPNRIGLNKLTCREHNAYIRINRKPLEDIRAEFRNAALTQLDKGNAVAAGICEDFLRGDSALTIESCEERSSGYHAITVSGYRCINGKIEYELANSWGNHCPAKSGTKDSVIECEMDEKGWPTGRFWVKEDNLLKNLSSFYEISQ